MPSEPNFLSLATSFTRETLEIMSYTQIIPSGKKLTGIFEPYRAIDYITSEVPFSIQRLGIETFVTISVSKAWQVYDYAKLTLVMVVTWSKLRRKVNYLLLFGGQVLSVDIKGNLFIWAFKDLEQNLKPIRHIFLENFSPSCLMHPDLYQNKVTVGGQEGLLQLWNISTRKKLYEFKD